MGLFIIQLVNGLLSLYGLIILARALISWAPLDPWHPVVRFLRQATDPVIEPIRRFLPLVGPFDFSPFVALLLVELVRRLLVSVLTSFLLL